jgi:hypothetical protein
MDSLITAAARALVARDPLGALKRVALRDDAPALALRGIAMRSSAISFERRPPIVRSSRVRSVTGTIVARQPIALGASFRAELAHRLSLFRAPDFGFRGLGLGLLGV